MKSIKEDLLGAGKKAASVAKDLLGKGEKVLEQQNAPFLTSMDTVREFNNKTFGQPGYANPKLTSQQRAEDLIGRLNLALPMELVPGVGGGAAVHKSIEQIANEANGWKDPTLKVKFDRALMDNDAATLKELLPQAPVKYLNQFADKITGILSPTMTQVLSNSPDAQVVYPPNYVQKIVR